MARIKLMNLKMLKLVETDSLRNVLFDSKVSSVNTVLGYKKVNNVEDLAYYKLDYLQ
jgi:hypothetical protein